MILWLSPLSVALLSPGRCEMKTWHVVTAIGLTVFFMMTTWGEALAAAECGEPVAAPKYQIGDKWTWRNEKGVEIVREVVGFEGELAQIRWSNPSSQPDKEGTLFIDADGVIRKAIRPIGKVVTTQGRRSPFDSIGQRVLDFPLQVGKEWKHSFMSASGDLGWQHYSAVACEEVATAAGRFAAMKIETKIALPRWQGTYHFWYAPAVKANIKHKFPGGFGATALDNELIKYEAK
jgi:hypothetical protein